MKCFRGAYCTYFGANDPNRQAGPKLHSLELTKNIKSSETPSRSCRPLFHYTYSPLVSSRHTLTGTEDGPASQKMRRRARGKKEKDSHLDPSNSVCPSAVSEVRLRRRLVAL